MPRGLGKKCRRPLADVLPSHILHMRCDPPLMSKRIRHLAVTITPELILQRHINLRAGGHRSPERLIRILNVKEQIDPRRPRSDGRARFHFAV